MTKNTVSAGGVVLNAAGEVVVVNQDGLSWSLPKGHIDPGETAKEAAEREIREESGITQLTYCGELGAYERYRIGLDVTHDDTSELKHIYMFLFMTEQQEFVPTDLRHKEVRWVKIADVAALLTHGRDKAFFTQTVSSGLLDKVLDRKV